MEHMEVMQLGEGFWRWTAPHPEWTPAKERPGGWGQMVGCLYLETSDGIVLIDPLAPPDESDDGRRFWEVLDREVARLGVDPAARPSATRSDSDRSALPPACPAGRARERRNVMSPA